MIGVRRRRGEEEKGPIGEKTVMATEAETGVMRPQAKERQGLLAKARSWEEARKDTPYRFQRKHGPVDTLILDF